jgi:hypothetical protein
MNGTRIRGPMSPGMTLWEAEVQPVISIEPDAVYTHGTKFSQDFSRSGTQLREN